MGDATALLSRVRDLRRQRCDASLYESSSRDFGLEERGQVRASAGEFVHGFFCCSANQGHGLRRSNSDKRRAVITALAHPRGVGMSDRLIAEHCGVVHPFVAAVRSELSDSDSSPQPRAGADGKVRVARPVAKKRRELAEKRAEAGRRGGEAKARAVKRAAEPDPLDPHPFVGGDGAIGGDVFAYRK